MSKTQEEKRKAKGVDEWFEAYKIALIGLTDFEIALVESYRIAVRRGIELATANDSNLHKIKDLDVRCECLEYEELIYFIPVIIRSWPSYNYVTTGVKNIANMRKYSWFKPKNEEVNFDFSPCHSDRNDEE